MKWKQKSHPQIALTAEMRTEGGWLSCNPLTVACRNCWMSSGDIAAVKRLAAHKARPSRNGEAAGNQITHGSNPVIIFGPFRVVWSKWKCWRRLPGKLRSARMTLARNPCISNCTRPFFTFSVMMVLTDPSASMQASCTFHLQNRGETLMWSNTIIDQDCLW